MPFSFRCAALALVCSAVGAHADGPFPGPAPTTTFGSSKLLLTGGVASIDGAAGGGLTPWALTGGHASEHEIGATAAATRVVTRDYALTGYAAAFAWNERVEVSLAHQDFDASAAVPGATLRMDIVGLKVRIAGDAILLDSDRWMPQVAVGLESKHVSPGAAVGGVLDAVQAKRDGIDVYVSATKLLLGPGVLLNGTLRATKANQNGLLGFGSVDHDRYRFKPEVSVAWLLNRHLAVGAEVRTKPDNLLFAGEAFRENAWRDVFIAWAPVKRVSLTAAWVDLGNIVGKQDQTGMYLSGQFSF